MRIIWGYGSRLQLKLKYLTSAQDLIEKLQREFLVCYVNTGASQFLRDFSWGALIKKSVELWKHILQEGTKEKSESLSR